MDDLRKVFVEDGLTKIKCTILSEDRAKALQLELIEVVAISPGVVLDDEFVARQIFSPIHYDEDQDEIVAAAFQDVSDKGLSVNRLNYASEQDIHTSGLVKAEKDRERRPNRKYIGFVESSVGDIRSIFEDEIRIFTVYDSALPQAEHHADICQIFFEGSVQGLPKKVANMDRRKKLQEKFQKFFKV